MQLVWNKAPKNNGFFARTTAGEYHVYRAVKGRREHEATFNDKVIGLWSDAADAMADISRVEATKSE